MRLIRLTTENQDGIFDNQFNHDILLPTNGKIGLNSITFQQEENTILINTNNNTIEWTLDLLNDVYKVTLQTGLVYSSNDYTELMIVIENAINRGLSNGGEAVPPAIPDQLVVGKQFRMTIGANAKIQSEFKTGGCNFISDDWTIPTLTSNVQVTGVQGDTTREINHTTAPPFPPVNTNIIYNGEQGWSKGWAEWRLHLERFSNNSMGDGNNGFIMGFTKKKPSKWTGVDGAIADEDIIYGIRNITGNNDAPAEYEYKRSETDDWVDTGVDVQNVVDGQTDTNDAINWQLEDNGISVYLEFTDDDGDRDHIVLMGGGGGGGLLPFNTTRDVDLYPFIVVRGSNLTFGIRHHQITLNPFQVGKNGTFPPDTFINYNRVFHEFSPSLGDATTPNPTTTHSKYSTGIDQSYKGTLTLEYNVEMNKYLGYRQAQPMSSIIDFPNGITGYNFIASVSFNSNLLMNAYILELMSGLSLETYDGYSNNRRNMLAVIPSRMLNNMIYYEPNNVNFINIRNDGTRTIRNLKARILDSELNPIRIVGMAMATILIYDNDTD